MSADCCERVACSTAKTMTLAGAPHAFREFRDVMLVGGLVCYELCLVTRSMTTISIELGVAAFSPGKLTRITVLRSADGKRATRFARGAETGTYYVRATTVDLL